MARNFSRLLALSDKEFRKRREAPTQRKFKRMRLDLSKFDASWDERRGAAVRMLAVILSDDDEALYTRVCADKRSVDTFNDAIVWFKKEATYLRKTADLYDTGIGRIAAILARGERTQAIESSEVSHA